MWYCIRCFFRDKRYLLVFGIIYTISMINMILSNNHKDSFGNSEEARLSVKVLEDSLGLKKATLVPISKNVVTLLINGTKVTYDCSKMSAPTYLPKNTRPLTALASFPGSGNTWLRVLLSSLTGINTGDIYKDSAFSRTPGFSNRKDDTVIAIKTHHPFWDDTNGLDPLAPKDRYWERAIVIVRHPLDATISGFNFFKTKGSHVRAAPIHKFLTKSGEPTPEWRKWAHDQIRNWGRCIKYWVVDFQGPVYMVFYENLLTNLGQELADLNSFLGLPLDEPRLSCTLKSNSQNKFKRKDQIDKRILFDSSMLSEVEAVLNNTKHLLQMSYRHIKPGFSMPESYAENLIQVNYAKQELVSSEKKQ